MDTSGAPAQVAVLHPVGELDLASLPDLRADLAAGARPGVRLLVVDLAEVSFLDAAVLGLLAVTAAELAGRGLQLVVRHPRPMARKVLGITGLDAVLMPEV